MNYYALQTRQRTSSEIRRESAAKFAASTDPLRYIAVSVAPHIGSINTPRIAFFVRQRTPTRDVVEDILRGLPQIEHPFDIVTSGPNSKVLPRVGRPVEIPRGQWLPPDPAGPISNFLPSYASPGLGLQLDIHYPEPARPEKETSGKKSMSSMLRKALGRTEENSSEPSDEKASEPRRPESLVPRDASLCVPSRERVSQPSRPKTLEPREDAPSRKQTQIPSSSKSGRPSSRSSMESAPPSYEEAVAPSGDFGR